MKTTKQDLAAKLEETQKALSLHELYLYHAFRSEVTFFFKGNHKVGICGETRAHGGIVVEAMKEEAGKWYVLGVKYYEHALAEVSSPNAFPTEELMRRRSIFTAVQAHVRDVQAKAFNIVPA